MPLNEMIANDGVDMSKYPEGVVNLYKIDGECFGLPKDFDTIGLLYNKELFDAKGIAYPDDTWDWEKLVEVAAALTDPAEGVYGMAAEVSRQEVYYNFIYQSGGTVLNDDNSRSGFDMPESVDAIQYMYDLIHKYKVSPTVQQLAETQPKTLFSSGKLAMMFLGSWNVSWMVNDEYVSKVGDITVLPSGKVRATMYNGLANSASAFTEHKEAVWAWLKFLGSYDAQLIGSQNGSAISAYEGTQEPWVDFRPEYNLGSFIEQLPYAVQYPYIKESPQYLQFEKEIIIKILNNEIGIEEGCRSIAERVNYLLDS